MRRRGRKGWICRFKYLFQKILFQKIPLFIFLCIYNKKTQPQSQTPPSHPLLSIIPIPLPLLLSIHLMRIQSLRLWNRIIFRPAAVPRRARRWRSTRRVSRRRIRGEVGHEDGLGAIRGRTDWGRDGFGPARVSAATAAAGEEPVDLVWAPPGDDDGDDYGDDGDDDAG